MRLHHASLHIATVPTSRNELCEDHILEILHHATIRELSNFGLILYHTTRSPRSTSQTFKHSKC